MKQLLLLPVLSIGVLQAGVLSKPSGTHIPHFTGSDLSSTSVNFKLPLQKPGGSHMPAAVFKAQEYCRAEVKDFEFDAPFTVVGATVYFSGANFKVVEKGYINSNSLRPIRSLMDRCMPGSVVIFDEVKVKGPDNTIRTIQGLSLILD